MKRIALISKLSGCFFIMGACQAALPKIPNSAAGAAEWRAQAIATVKEAGNEPIDIQVLGLFLFQLKACGYRDCPEKDEIVSMLEDAILSNPERIEFYKDEMLRLRMQAREDIKKPESEIARLRYSGKMVEFGDYERFRTNAFCVLQWLPSHKTVEVLASFLNDPEDWPKRISDAIPFPPNREAAVIALNNLGIENPPFSTIKGRHWYQGVSGSELDAWKTWWNDIEAGKRTFRLNGSTVEYGPDGPVRSAKPAKLEEPVSSGYENRARVWFQVIAMGIALIALFLIFALLNCRRTSRYK